MERGSARGVQGANVPLKGTPAPFTACSAVRVASQLLSCL